MTSVAEIIGMSGFLGYGDAPTRKTAAPGPLPVVLTAQTDSFSIQVVLF